jgi:type IV pilus assembly protein PilX
MFSLRHTARSQRRRGVAYVFALLFLILLTALSTALYSSASLSLRQGANLREQMSARAAAEGGLNYMLYALGDVSMPASTSIDSLIPNLESALNTTLGQTPNLNGSDVSSTGISVVVPPISLGTGTFQCTFSLMTPEQPGQQRLRLRVEGTSGQASHTVSVVMTTTERRASIFDYGIASRGKILISGSAVVDGMNSPDEATVLSMSSEPVAIEAGGHATVGGDLYVTSDNEGAVRLYGNLTVGGTSDLEEIMYEHVHTAVDEPEFPEIDVSPFVAMTTSVIDSDTDLNGTSLVFTNARVAANTNPDFRNTTVINGVLYIESPNVVTFHAGTTIKAIIVTEEDPLGEMAENQIDFRGHVIAPGVDALPDTPEFAAVKQESGSVILAPGFGVTFRGCTNSVNGVIAADQFSFLGASDISGDLTGSVLGLKDLPVKLAGNASIRINRLDSHDTPGGFVLPLGLMTVPDTYLEGTLQ